MDNMFFSILLACFGLFLGGILVIVINYIKGNILREKAEKMLENAKKEAEIAKKEMIAETKQTVNELKMEAEKEIKEKKSEIKDLEDKILQRENNIDKRDENLSKRENSLDEREKNITKKQEELQEEKGKLDEIKNEQLQLLEKISSLSKKDAEKMLLKTVEDDLTKEIAALIKEKEDTAKLESDRIAKNLIVMSMQKYSNDVTNEQTISVLALPNDDMKGRIIGREGRNIRTIEAITGVDLIIDDTPEAIVLSSFDPLRREIAKVTLETLIKDGRIHPSRIEELYDKTCKEISDTIKEYGEQAIYEVGLTKVEPELIELIGKLYYRTSYGQNALQHSMEVAHLCGIMAAELGENVNLAKRAGLLHDIGKAIDFETEGSHVQIGIDLAKKYGEDKVVINAIASHHGDNSKDSVISWLVEIADILSASRPGARSDSTENYIKRLIQLESIANSFNGIDKAYAVQAGREIRVMVKPEEVDDLTSHKIARDIKLRIEKEMQYPGTIKVTVVRETRATEEAK